MEPTYLIAAGSLITVIVGAVIAYRNSNSDNKAKSITGEVVLSDYWQKRSGTVEDRLTEIEKDRDGLENRIREITKSHEKEVEELKARISLLEQGVIDREVVHSKAIKEKDVRIDELEERIDTLENELLKYRRLDEKVDNAKAELHDNVEQNLNDLKK